MADWRAPLMSAVCYLDPKAALKQINVSNVNQLKVAWTYEVSDASGNKTSRTATVIAPKFGPFPWNPPF